MENKQKSSSKKKPLKKKSVAAKITSSVKVKNSKPKPNPRSKPAKPKRAKAVQAKAAGVSKISKNKKTKSAKLHTSKPAVAHGKSTGSLAERNWAMYCHLAAFAGFIIPFGNIIGPAIVWLLKREEFPSMNAQGKEALNFQLSMTIYFFVALILTLVFIGFLIIPILIIMQIIYVISAAIKAQEGKLYHYPFTIHFLKK